MADFSSLNGYNVKDAVARAAIQNLNNMESVAYSELVTLKNNSELTEGKFYRITDYSTTTTQPETQSAGNQFDIIVVADSSSVLNENAGAIQHTTESTDYFYGQKLSAWKLKYDINNDTSKYAWADSTNGKGVIYELEDEYGNKCGYDFKNIQMKFYKITATTTKTTDLLGTYSNSRRVSSSTNTQMAMSSSFTTNASDFEWRYTFDMYKNNTHYDYSLNRLNYSVNNNVFCYDNIVNALLGDYSSRLSEN